LAQLWAFEVVLLEKFDFEKKGGGIFRGEKLFALKIPS